MTISTDLDGRIEARDDVERVIRAHSIMCQAADTINEVVTEINEMISAGIVNDIPADLRAAMNTMFGFLNTAKNSIDGDTGVQEMLNWTETA